MALNKTEEKIYELLKEKATSHNEEGTFCVYPRKELAFDCGVNEKTVQRTLNELERTPEEIVEKKEDTIYNYLIRYWSLL